MAWKTYLILHFGTEGKKPTEVGAALESVGFAANLGAVDYVYEWPSEPNKDQILELADRVAEAIKGSGAVFNIDTQDQE